MIVEVDGNDVRIMGKINGKTRHILIHVMEENGNDIYDISLVRDGFVSGCLPTVCINKEVITARNNSLRIGVQVID